MTRPDRSLRPRAGRLEARADFRFSRRRNPRTGASKLCVDQLTVRRLEGVMGTFVPGHVPTNPAARAAEFIALCADNASFREWYDGALPRVYGYVQGRAGGDASLAEEITQQAFISAIRARTKFDGRSDPVTWLCSIARNALTDHYRQVERERRRHLSIVVSEIPMDDPSPAERRDERDEVVAALAELSNDQRTAVLMRYVDRLPVRDIARLIGRSEAATESLLSRSRERLRSLLEVASDDR